MSLLFAFVCLHVECFAFLRSCALTHFRSIGNFSEGGEVDRRMPRFMTVQIAVHSVYIDRQIYSFVLLEEADLSNQTEMVTWILVFTGLPRAHFLWMWEFQELVDSDRIFPLEG